METTCVQKFVTPAQCYVEGKIQSPSKIAQLAPSSGHPSPGSFCIAYINIFRQLFFSMINFRQKYVNSFVSDEKNVILIKIEKTQTVHS